MSIRAIATVELKRIEDENGGVLPNQKIVDDARRADSPLHHLFEWDNDVCGEKYRLIQAARLVRIVREEIGEDEYGQTKYVRAYTSAKQAGRDEAGYLRTSDVLQSPISEAILLKALKREIGTLTKKYGHLKEFGAIVRGEIGDLAG